VYGVHKYLINFAQCIRLTLLQISRAICQSLKSNLHNEDNIIVCPFPLHYGALNVLLTYLSYAFVCALLWQGYWATIVDWLIGIQWEWRSLVLNPRVMAGELPIVVSIVFSWCTHLETSARNDNKTFARYGIRIYETIYFAAFTRQCELLLISMLWNGIHTGLNDINRPRVWRCMCAWDLFSCMLHGGGDANVTIEYESLYTQIADCCNCVTWVFYCELCYIL